MGSEGASGEGEVAAGAAVEGESGEEEAVAEEACGSRRVVKLSRRQGAFLLENETRYRVEPCR